jgi:hypothetical protein
MRRYTPIAMIMKLGSGMASSRAYLGNVRAMVRETQIWK